MIRKLLRSFRQRPEFNWEGWFPISFGTASGPDIPRDLAKDGVGFGETESPEGKGTTAAVPSPHGEGGKRLMTLYEKLLEKIAEHPMGAPRDETILAILRELFDVEEAELALSMSLKGLSASEIAGQAGISLERASSLLEGMANKGIIYCVKTGKGARYALMPPMPGFFEFSLMKGERNPRTDRMGKLWDNYFKNALADEMHGTSIPMSRVVQVQKSIPYEGMEIFPHDHAVELVNSSLNVALGKCQCRFSVQKCDAPLDVCIMLNNWADFTIDRGLAVKVSKDEAIEALHRARDAGLVPTCTNTKGPVPYICNCCPCCCFMLRGVIEFKHSTLAKSGFIAVVDETACIGCGECTERCPFGAMALNAQEKAETTSGRCYGCGVCSVYCPEGAISMARRKEIPEPYDSGQSLIMDIARDKRKSDAVTPGKRVKE